MNGSRFWLGLSKYDGWIGCTVWSVMDLTALRKASVYRNRSNHRRREWFPSSETFDSSPFRLWICKFHSQLLDFFFVRGAAIYSRCELKLKKSRNYLHTKKPVNQEPKVVSLCFRSCSCCHGLCIRDIFLDERGWAFCGKLRVHNAWSS